jgi:hypothetical protein
MVDVKDIDYSVAMLNRWAAIKEDQRYMDAALEQEREALKKQRRKDFIASLTAKAVMAVAWGVGVVMCGFSFIGMYFLLWR